MSINKVILLGRLGVDPELRYAPNQTPICTFRMATNERRKTPEGEWTDATEWHRIVTFGKTAENCKNFLQKGRQAFVEGRIRTNKWQDQEGKDRYSTEIVASNVQFIGGRADGIEIERTGSQRQSNPAELASMSAMGETVSFDDDDIPF